MEAFDKEDAYVEDRSFFSCHFPRCVSERLIFTGYKDNVHFYPTLLLYVLLVSWDLSQTQIRLVISQKSYNTEVLYVNFLSRPQTIKEGPFGNYLISAHIAVSVKHCKSWANLCWVSGKNKWSNFLGLDFCFYLS